MWVAKVDLLFTNRKKKIIFIELQLIFDTDNLHWKPKNILPWWLVALSFCQIWKNFLAPLNVDLKDYLILSASLENFLPWITLLFSKVFIFLSRNFTATVTFNLESVLFIQSKCINIQWDDQCVSLVPKLNDFMSWPDQINRSLWKKPTHRHVFINMT